MIETDAGEICYERNQRTGSECTRRECRYWISHGGAVNCTLVAASKGPMTLQQIGEIIGVTRMRVCQLEKKILHDLQLGWSAPASGTARGMGPERSHPPRDEARASSPSSRSPGTS